MYNNFIKETVFKTMRDETQRTVKNYATDVAIDVESIMAIMYINKMVWACRESGTHLIYDSNKYKLDTVDAIIRNNSNIKWFLIDVKNETIQQAETIEQVKTFLQ